MTVSAETLDRAELPEIRAQVMKEIDRTPHTGYGVRSLAIPYLQLAAMIAVLYALPEGLLWKIPYFVLMGWSQYRLYFPIHEACHAVLFRSPRVNRVVGQITAALLFNSFTSFTWIHMEHHRLWGKAEDPGAIDYFVHFRNRLHTLYFFVGPLLGFNIAAKVWINLALPALRSLRGMRSEGAARSTGAGAMPVADIPLIVAVQAVVFLSITGMGSQPWNYAIFYMLPILTVHLSLARLRMYLEHGPLDYGVSDYFGANRRKIARTHLSNRVLGPILNGMNFRFHREHHLFPTFPSSTLPEIHARYVRPWLDPDDSSPDYLRSIAQIARISDSP